MVPVIRGPLLENADYEFCPCKWHMLPKGIMVNGASGWVGTTALCSQLCVYAQDCICEPSGRKDNPSKEGDSIMCSRSNFFFRR